MTHESPDLLDARAPAPKEKPVREYQLSDRLDADAMEAFLRAKDLIGAKEFASTIEKLAVFDKDRKDLVVDRPPKNRSKED